MNNKKMIGIFLCMISLSKFRTASVCVKHVIDKQPYNLTYRQTFLALQDKLNRL